MRSPVAVLLFLLTACAAPADSAAKTLCDLAWLRSPEARDTPAARGLLAEAPKALAEGPWSVMDKPVAPPSGDMHDYFSVPPYWFPNPNTPNGLPYIRKDGVVNPDRNKYDNSGLNAMCRTVETLALAYALSGNDDYAARAALLLRTWFLEPATRMNPNLNFAQGVPGLKQGRAEGIIDTVCLARLCDCIELCMTSPAFGAETLGGLRAWFSAYLDWLRESPLGRREAAAGNNHGTCYDVQAVRYAFFTGRDDVAREILQDAATQRIEKQVEPDGRQPRELSRTKSFDYSLKNLEALMDLADLARPVGIDLWGYSGKDGRSIRAAFEFILARAFGELPWPGENIHGMNVPRFLPLLQRAVNAWKLDAHAKQLATHQPEAWPADRAQLWYPKKTNSPAHAE